MVTSNQSPQLPRTKPIKVSRKRYDEIHSIAKKQDCTLDDALDMYIEHRSNDIAKRNPITIEKPVEKVATREVVKPVSFDSILMHLKSCGNCLNGMIDRGYILISIEELKQHKLVPKRQPECYRYGHTKSCECFL